ncbi:hypothetical protein Tco_0421432 [Tanacetum coccineum]
MSSASNVFRITLSTTDSEPGEPVAPLSMNYVPGAEHPPSPDYVPDPKHLPLPVEVPYVPEPEYPKYLVSSDAKAPLADQPLPADASPTALSPGYVADSDPDKDPEEDPEEDHTDYPADGGDGDDEPSYDDDDDDDIDDEDEEPFEDEDDDKEEEKHLAPADSSVVPVVDLVPLAGDTEAFETDESAPTPRSPQIRIPFAQTRLRRARKTVRLESPMLPSMEARIAEYAAAPTPPLPPPSLLSPWSSPLPQIPSPPLPPPPSSLSVYHPMTEDVLEAELPPCKRLCLTAPTWRYEVEESSTAAPRPTGGHRVDYGFIGTLDSKTRHQRAEEDIYAVIEDAQDRQTQLSQRFDVLTEDIKFHYETALLLDQEALVSREAWAQSVGLSLAVHYELQAYRTHTQIQDYRIASQESLIATLITQISSLQGQLSAALRQIQALQARDQTHVDDVGSRKISQPTNDDFSQHLSDDEVSYHEDALENGTATNKPKQQQQLIPNTTTISNIKLPILKKEEYDIWAMEMEHYLEYIDNDVWKVIQNGNSKKRISTGKDGVVRILPPVSAAEIHVVEKERKARTILLMAIPKEHLRRFHGMDDAKEIWEAIRTRFGGNANSKKMQKAVLKQQFEAFTISSSEGLEKGYDRFQQLLSQLEAHGAEVSTKDANHTSFSDLCP